MATDRNERSTPTRRQCLRCGGAIAGGGLLAGCTGRSDDGSDGTGTATDGSAATETATATGTATDDQSYSVRMAPAGEVTFESVPEQWVAYCGEFADMAVALGQADGMTGIGGNDRYYTYVYDEPPGVDVDEERLAQYPEVRTKEEFYELDSDVHLYDTGMLVNWFDWSESDVVTGAH